MKPVDTSTSNPYEAPVAELGVGPASLRPRVRNWLIQVGCGLLGAAAGATAHVWGPAGSYSLRVCLPLGFLAGLSLGLVASIVFSIQWRRQALRHVDQQREEMLAETRQRRAPGPTG